MKIVIFLTIVGIWTETALSLPTPKNAAAYEDIYYSSTKLSDPNSALRMKVKQHVRSFVVELNEIVGSTLNEMPYAAPYETSREKLSQFLNGIERFIGPAENCVWNIIDMTVHLNMLSKYFERTDATAAERDTWRLLDKNGLRIFRREKFGRAWKNYMEEKFGPAAEMNYDYC